MKSKSVQGDALMLLAAVLWGAAFVAQRAAMRHMGPMTFNGVRFALGALALLPVIAFFRRRRAVRQTDGSTPVGSLRLHIVGGVAAGLVLLLAATLQQAGIVYTTAGKAGFITGLYMPLVPILGLFLGQRTSFATWTGATLAVVGLYFLSITGPMQINRGDGLVMLCAVVWAVQVLLIGILAPKTDPLLLGLVQFSVVAVGSLIGAGWAETITMDALRAGAVPIAYGGLVSVGIAFTLQLVGQRTSPPAHAALLLSLETVFAGLTGYWILGERFGGRELAGAALMLVGMLLSQLPRLAVRERAVDLNEVERPQSNSGL
jgi:drug/metabolite transporter (DMT)-like permease